MARILVMSDDGATVVDIFADDEGRTEARCRAGCEVFQTWALEETVQAAVVHVDQRH